MNRNTKSRKENPKNTDNSRHKTKNKSKQYKNTTQKMSNTDPSPPKNQKNKQIKLGLNLCAVPTSYRVPLVEQELLTIPERPSSPPVFRGVRVTRSLVLYACFVDRCLFFCTFSVGHCVVCSSSIYGF